MKNKKIYLFALLSFFSFSCEENLESEVFDTISKNNEAITNPSPVLKEALIASAYTPLIGGWGGHDNLWTLKTLSSDEMCIAQKGTDWFDGGIWLQTHQHKFQPNNTGINNAWNYLIGGIANTNLKIKDFKDTPSVVQELRGLRAMQYAWAIDMFENMPLLTEKEIVENPEALNRSEIFKFVEKELLEVIPDLKKPSEINASSVIEKARFNQLTAYTVLADLYLNSEVYTGASQWDKAIEFADKVIQSGTYTLEDYKSTFSADNGNSQENIFVIPYSISNGGFNLPQMALHYNSQFTFDLQEQPWNGYQTLEEFYNLYEEDDSRKKINFLVGTQLDSKGKVLLDTDAEESDPDGQPLNFTPAINELFPNALRQSGVRVAKFEYKKGSTRNLENDFPIYRYAQILMIKAEAMWRKNNSSMEALALVNQIRSRAGAKLLTSLDAKTILDELGREFYAEGKRRTDLIRFGEFNKSWWWKKESSKDANFFPIPSTQVELNPNFANKNKVLPSVLDSDF